MPLYVGDYLSDTMLLSTEEHGAYLLLLMTMWKHGGVLPDHDASLARIVRATPERWLDLRDCLSHFFRIHDGCWRHKRVEEEIQTALKMKARASKAAGIRWANNEPPDDDDAPQDAKSMLNGMLDGCLTDAKGDAKSMLNRCPSPSPSPSPSPTPTPSPSPLRHDASHHVVPGPNAEKRLARAAAIRYDPASITFQGITPKMLAAWSDAYPAVNVKTELAKAASWLHANPKNRKSQYTRFLVNWLSRAQDRAPAAGAKQGVAKRAAVEAHNDAVADQLKRKLKP
jgi:uncharacterized protein YdaU (DUF1376 family)